MTNMIEAFDARADDARRQVEVSAERIVIARRVGGVDMRIGLTPRQYRGVALCVLVAEATDFLFTVRLVHADPELDVTLGHCDSEAAAQALWRRWATAFGLPGSSSAASANSISTAPKSPAPSSVVAAGRR